MTSERLLNMSIEGLYLPKNVYPQNKFLATLLLTLATPKTFCLLCSYAKLIAWLGQREYTVSMYSLWLGYMWRYSLLCMVSPPVATRYSGVPRFVYKSRITIAIKVARKLAAACPWCLSSETRSVSERLLGYHSVGWMADIINWTVRCDWLQVASSHRMKIPWWYF